MGRRHWRPHGSCGKRSRPAGMPGKPPGEPGHCPPAPDTPSPPADTASPQGRHLRLHPHQVMGMGTGAACSLMSRLHPRGSLLPRSWAGLPPPPSIPAGKHTLALPCFLPVPPSSLLVRPPLPKACYPYLWSRINLSLPVTELCPACLWGARSHSVAMGRSRWGAGSGWGAERDAAAGQGENSSWVIPLPGHGFGPQQVPSCPCSRLGHPQGPCGRWPQATSLAQSSGMSQGRGWAEGCVQATQHTHLASSCISAAHSAPSSR